MANENKYGLIVRDKAKSQLTFKATRNVFGDDSDSDSEKKAKPVLLQPSSNINRQAKITQEKAIIEDPTVYQYDEIYDSMSKEKEMKKVKTKEEKKPKYIETLLKTANKRKLENERRIERQIQKEREKEGEEFADKEIFVTSAYKKKLEELRIEEEKEKYEEYLENIGDVTKQKDLGGFYRHLYEQKLGSDKLNYNKNTIDKDNENIKQNQETVIEISKNKDDSASKVQPNKSRNYRKRKNSKLSDGEIEDTDNEINFSNLDDIKTFKRSKATQDNIDADSDFSIDESSDEELPDKKENSAVIEEEKPKDIIKETLKSPEVVKVEEKPKPKVDIWKKRTVGEVFDQALIRYFERKASRAA